MPSWKKTLTLTRSLCPLRSSTESANMKRYILAAMCLLPLSCGVPTTGGGDPNCTGNTGKVYSCSVGSCSRSGGSNCSAAIDGVSCCTAGTNTGGTNDGTSNCALGWCWTNPENICCPQNAQYACKGLCYTSNVCAYTSY